MASQRLPHPSAQQAHEVVNARGERVGFYANKSAAGRGLARIRRAWDGGWRPLGLGVVVEDHNPHTFTIRPVRKEG
jgi:hypothetical protein